LLQLWKDALGQLEVESETLVIRETSTGRKKKNKKKLTITMINKLHQGRFHTKYKASNTSRTIPTKLHGIIFYDIYF